MPATTYMAGWGDYDGDGLLDALVPRASTGNPVTDRPRPNLLYRNNGDGSFTLEGPDEVGPIATDESSSNVGLWGDVNNDGRLDVLVLNLSLPDVTQAVINRLYLNQGNGTFTSAQAGALTQSYTVRAVGNWCDYDNDGFLDIFLPSSRSAGDASKQHLLHGRGDGSFDTVTEGSMATDQPGVIDPLWSDLDGDGDVDLLVPYYGQHNLVYRNDGHGRFTRLTNSLLELPQHRFIGPLSGDLDNDGDLDLVANTATPEALTVFLNDGQGAFVPSRTVPEFRIPFLSDYDNDGDLDLLFSDDPTISPLTPLQLYRNDGSGQFQRVADAFTRTPWSGGPWVDDNNDGFMDLHAFRRSGDKMSNVVFRNQGNGNHWLKFRLVGTASNRSAIGAKVRVKATFGGKTVSQMRELISHWLAEDGLRAHFGLADATSAEEVRIEWPSGNVQTLTGVTVDQILTVTEPTFFQPVQPVATINGSVRITNTVVASARQWYFEGTPLADQTGRVLGLTKIQPSQSGRYTVVAQTAAGPQTNHVYLRVLTQFTKILEGDIVTEEYGFNSVTLIDLDRDGWLDAYVPHDYDSRSVPSDSLFRNQGDGTFLKMPDGPLTLRAGSSLVGAFVDYDRDGNLDAVVVRGGSPSVSKWQLDLLRGDGAARFQLASGLPPLASTDQPMDVAWADYDRDGDLDLLVAKGYQLLQSDALYRNNGDGTFTAMTANQVGNLVNDRLDTYMCNWTDFNGDGWPDALVQHMNGTLRLHRNNGDGTFSSVQAGSLTAMRNDQGFSWGDYDNDGFPDLFAGMWDQGPARLHRNLAGATFTNIVSAGDLTQSKLGLRGQGVWGDYDNDGFLDLLVVGITDPGALYRNRGDGTFEQVEVGNLVTDGIRRQAPVWVDYDNNGFLDLMVPCGDFVLLPDVPPQRCQLYRNNGNGNHWLKVKLAGTVSNRDGIGAKVRVRATLGGRSITQMREISGNSGFHGVPLLAHFGLGAATNATMVRVEWPSGIVQELPNVASDQFLTVTEPAPVRLTFARVAEGIRLEWRGTPNTSYTLQASADLRTWVPTRTVTADAAGVAATTISLDAESRFYRAVK